MDIAPETIRAGLTFRHVATVTAYPAPAWALSLLLRGPSSITLTAAPSGSQHVFSATAAQTAVWTPGEYWFSARVQNDTGLYEVDTGQIVIVPDMAQAAPGFDGRSQNRRTLDAINAVIEKRASLDQERYTINNRELWRTPIADLLKLQATYAARVAAEERKAKGRPVISQLKVRF